jgi:hypothetical protein
MSSSVYRKCLGTGACVLYLLTDSNDVCVFSSMYMLFIMSLYNVCTPNLLRSYSLLDYLLLSHATIYHPVEYMLSRDH